MHSRRQQRGLAAAAVIIVLILVAVALVLGRGFVQSGVSLSQRAVTDANIRRLSDALIQYASLNQRLPCPAPGTSDSGLEAATTTLLPSDTCTAADGVVPWSTLGLKRDHALDGWGRKISYRVFSGATGFTQANGVNMTSCNTSLGAPIDLTMASGSLCKSGSPPPNTPAQFLGARGNMLVVEDSGTTRNGNALVLVSHGESGYGAFLAEGATARTTLPTAGGSELANTQATGPFRILPRSDPGTSPDAASHFDDIVTYLGASEVATRAKLAARSWSQFPLSATFTTTNVAAAVAAAGGTMSGENTGLTSLGMGGFLITGTDSSLGARNIGIRTEDSITGIGVIGGGGGDLNSASGERLRFQLGSGSQFQKMDIALNRFRVIRTSPLPRWEERAEVSFWRGGDMLQASLVTSWVEAVAPARCLFALVSSAVFDRVDVRPIARTGDGNQTTFTVAEIKACSEATAICTTAVSNAVDCPNRPPSAASTTAEGIAATSATLKGVAHANGASTTVTFDYGTTCSYPSSIASSPGSLGAGAGNTTVTASITGLACNTSYYFRTKAVSAGGVTTGNDAMFTTTACAFPTPIATTSPVTGITQTSATLHGIASDNGASTAVAFEYGFTSCYGSSVAAAPGTIANGSGPTPVSASLAGLTCDTRYHYRVRAVSAAGTTTSSDMAFTTAPCP